MTEAMFWVPVIICIAVLMTLTLGWLDPYLQ